ncbi:phospholipase-like protein, partial [Tanacetum coccineum]
AFGGDAPVVVLWCCGGVVVGLWWCCGGAVVVLWWWCGAVVVVWFLWWWCGARAVVVVYLVWCCVVLNMETYEDEPVTLTISHGRFFMPHNGLRFWSEFDRYEVGPIPFRRLVFDSDKDGGHVNGQMLIDIINGEEFDNLHDEVAVAVCQLAVLHFVLLGRQLAHNIPDCWLRLIDDKNGTWEIYPWGTLVWAQLYGQLENANVVRAEKLYAAQNRPIPRAAKYTLSGFTWAFKGARPNRRLRPDAFEARAEWWVRSREFFDGRIHEAPPIPTPVKLPSRFDVPKNVDPRYDELINSIKELKKKNESHEKLLKKVYKFYQGQSQPKPMEVPEHYGLSDFDFSVLQNTESSSSFFDMAQRTPTYPKTFEEPIPSRHPTSQPGSPKITTPMPLQGFAPWSSTNQARPSVIPATPYIATPMSQQGFSLWSSINQGGPSQNHDVGVVNPDEMPRGKRETLPSKYQVSPFTCMPTTTVAPKKRANNTRNKTRSDQVSAFNIEKAGIDLNSPVEDLVYMGSHDTDVYISLHNVDPNKVVRNQYVDCMTFLGSPKPVFLDCGIKGFVVEEQFWRDLVPYVCKGGNNTKNNYQRFAWLSEDHINFWMELMIRDRPPGARYTVAKTGTSAMIEKSNKFVIETDFHLMGMLDGSSRPYPSWDDVDIVYMPINSGGDHWLMDHISKWTNVLNVLLEKAGHFERTGRQPYNFELVYNDGLEFASPQQGNTTLEFKCVLGCTTVVVRILKNVAMISLRYCTRDLSLSREIAKAQGLGSTCARRGVLSWYNGDQNLPISRLSFHGSLSIVGMDGNNQIVPVAFGICKGETGNVGHWWIGVSFAKLELNESIVQLQEMVTLNVKTYRLTVLMKLQEAIDEEAILDEQILTLMHRFANRFTDRRVEINNLMVLHDHPLVDYGKYALGCMTGADMKKCVYLKSVRDELLRSMEEKRQLMANYRDM